MGSLDDAIREHLELKRQRGASDDEVQKQEEEAFGRGRRPAPEPAPPEDELDDPLAPDDLDGPDELEAAEPNSNGQPADHGEPVSTLEPEPQPEPFEPFEPDEVPAAESLDPEMTVRDARDEPGGGWDDTEEREPRSSDPLQDTPDFLEGSPEEDRLWFEQRPPKDFDLD
jgi:hypothetical protein